MKTKDLLEKRAALTQEAEAICDTEAERDLTAEEEARFAAISAELKGLDGKIARATEVEQRKASTPLVIRGQATTPALSPEGASGPEAKTLFVNDAEFFAVVASGKDDQRLARYRTEQSFGDGTSGGFMVPKEYSQEILRVSSQGGVFRQRGARVLPAGSNPDASIGFPVLNQSTANAAAPANVYGGVTVAWGAEGAAVGATGFKLKDVELKPNECTAYIPVTNKLLRNWTGAGGLISGLLDEARAADEDLQFAEGNGIGKPLGVLNAGACIAVERADTGRFGYDDAVAMVAKLLMRGGSAFWRMSQSVMPDLLKMKNENDELIWQPNAREGIPQSLLGLPIEWAENAAQLGSAGDVSLLNLPYYFIKDGYGPIIAGSEHVLFLNNKTVFKMGYSVDGQPWLEEPFTTNNGYTTSPFVKLAA
jgi:HK97 family phage major capsid protein